MLYEITMKISLTQHLFRRQHFRIKWWKLNKKRPIFGSSWSRHLIEINMNLMRFIGKTNIFTFTEQFVTYGVHFFSSPLKTKKNKLEFRSLFFKDVTCDIVFRLVATKYLRRCFMNFLECNFLQPAKKGASHVAHACKKPCVLYRPLFWRFFTNIAKWSEHIAHSNVWIGKLGHKIAYVSTETS